MKEIRYLKSRFLRAILFLLKEHIFIHGRYKTSWRVHQNLVENLEKVFEWCKKLETHLMSCIWEIIPNDDIKRMLQSCIKEPTRREIVLFYPTKLSFERCEKGVFFYRNVEKIFTNMRKVGNRNH